MKKMITITVVFLLAVSFLVAGSTRAEAAHNGAPQVLAGLTIVFGQPFVNAVAREVVYAGPGYAPAYPVHYRHAYPSTRYIERTRIIHGKPGHFMHRDTGRDHGKRHRDEWRRHENRHDRGDDARRDHSRSAH
jgi:hypothetical protein